MTNPLRRRLATLATVAATAAVLAACATRAPSRDAALPAIPAAADYCLAAERVVTRTNVPMRVEIQPDFAAFVKSKALIEGPTLQQFGWTATDGRLLAISCKLKSADHLVATFGPGAAGPDGSCQDMNRALYALVAREVREPVFRRVVFDPAETVVNEANPGMTGQDGLAPFTLAGRDPDGALRIRTKGFVVNFTDPRFASLPVRFRGVHYCHFIAPEHLRDLLEGRAEPGAVVGRTVEIDAPALPQGAPTR
jgi:hypothetical protein